MKHFSLEINPVDDAKDADVEILQDVDGDQQRILVSRDQIPWVIDCLNKIKGPAMREGASHGNGSQS